ncbi:DUF2130 domain-containing protein [Sulfurimonas hydrogeniphila]|uniref:DUF2130 domain-containing protein n=1 Tax=Sulfurimonas hydrogeniphila TaxID=2509341 RepID=UPI00125EC173|nr:DUF2130 domain-containing protein [Sulfurimonas hydrogeniphila]
MNTAATIKCPNCGSEINIEEALYSKLQTKFDVDRESERKKYKLAMQNLSAQKEAIEEKEAAFEHKLQEALSQTLSKEKTKMQYELTESIKKNLLEENALQLKQLQSELDQKSKQLQELNLQKAKVAQLEREKEELSSKIKAEAQIELNKKIQLERQKAIEEAAQANEMKLKAKEEQLDQIKKQLEDAKRKAEQGSQQLQGEAQEKSIEEYLSLTFKYDEITEIKKGAFGADCIQTINTPDFTNCGKICYESKNTKTFSNDWIAKLKSDMLDAKADVGVLVTAAKPKGMEQMGFIDGIWVCSYDEFKGSAALIREGIIASYMAAKSQENKTDKMTLLYNYFSGNEFSMQLQAIVSGFMAMQEELNKQKRSVMASWSRQQKQIDTVLLNTTNMYGNIKGIAGNAIANVEALELEHFEEEGEDV